MIFQVGDQNLYFNGWLAVIIEFSSSSCIKPDSANDVHPPLLENVCLTSCIDFYSVFTKTVKILKMNKWNQKPITHSSDYTKQKFLFFKKYLSQILSSKAGTDATARRFRSFLLHTQQYLGKLTMWSSNVLLTSHFGRRWPEDCLSLRSICLPPVFFIFGFYVCFLAYSASEDVNLLCILSHSLLKG